jgi:hypothetical protein
MRPEGAERMVIVGGLPCLGCGYDLRGRDISSVCPECGRAAQDSLASVWLWTPGRRRQARRGLSLTLAASPISILVYVGTLLLHPARRGELPLLALLVMGAAMSLGPALAARGLVQLARAVDPPAPSPAGPQRRPGRRLERAAIAYAVAYGVSVGIAVLGRGSYLINGLSLLSAMVVWIIWVLRNLWALAQLRILARRCGAGSLHRDLGWARFWAALCLLANLPLASFAVGMLGMTSPGGAWGALLAAGLIVLGWMLLWPFLLLRALNVLRRIERDLGREDGHVELRAAAPTGESPAGL